MCLFPYNYSRYDINILKEIRICGGIIMGFMKKDDKNLYIAEILYETG